MYFETKTILLGASEEMCKLSIEDYILESIKLEDIDYTDEYFSLLGKEYIQQMYPYHKDYVQGKHYIILTHISSEKKSREDNLYYNSFFEDIYTNPCNPDRFKNSPYSYKQGCINVLKFVKKIQLIAGINVFAGHIATYRVLDNGKKELEFVIPFEIPSYKILTQTFLFPSSKIDYENFAKEFFLELPQKEDEITLAFEFFINSLYEKNIKMSYLMLIIAFESLLSKENEIASNMSARYANFMATSKKEYNAIIKDLNMLYWVRNKLVHEAYWDKEYELRNIELLRDYVRKIILQYLYDIYGNMAHKEFLEFASKKAF